MEGHTVSTCLSVEVGHMEGGQKSVCARRGRWMYGDVRNKGRLLGWEVTHMEGDQETPCISACI